MLPALLLCALIAIQLAIVGYGLWVSATAASAGARASYVGGDAARAARSAIPVALREASRVRASEEVRVSVRVPSLLPGSSSLPVGARAGLGP